MLQILPHSAQYVSVRVPKQPVATVRVSHRLQMVQVSGAQVQVRSRASSGL